MASYVFDRTANDIARNTVSLVSDSFYMALVTTLPATSLSTLAGIVGEVVGGSYVRKNLAKSSGTNPDTYIVNSSSLRFNNPVWTGLWATAATPIVGGIIFKGTVETSASTDIAIGFVEISPSYVPPISPSPAPAPFTMLLQTAGTIIVSPG